MGGQKSKIITKDVPYEQIRVSSPVEMTSFCSPFRKYQNQKITKSPRDMEVTVSIIQPNRQTITIKQQCFTQLQNAFDMKTKNIELDMVLFDEHYFDQKIYIAKDNNIEKTIQIRPFVDFNTHAFNNILYELHMNQEISKIGSPNLNTVVDSYAIQTGLEIEGEEFPNSEVFVLQPIATNLSEIIKYRRENNWNWTVNEFNVLAYDVSKALLKLHENGISHNDIRPFNVFYSLDKECYQLGGFGNAVKKAPEVKSNIVRTSMAFGAPELETGIDFDLQQADIYSLGMTLLCAFYLCEPIDKKSVKPFNRKYEDKYKIMKAIDEMIMTVDRRQSLSKIMEGMKQGKSTPKMKSLIQSLRYKNTPKQRKLIQTKKALSEGYERLGLWNQWRNSLSEAYEMQQNSLDDYNKALSLSGLAKIQSCRGDPDNANQYAKKASKIFRNLGYAAYDQGNVNQALNLFNKSVESAKYFSNENDIDLAKNLQGLALAHSEKGDYQVAKPLISQATYLVQKNNGKDSLDYCKIKMSEAQIQTDFGEFQSASLILQECLSIAENKAQINEELGLQLKAQILHEKGKNLMTQASFEQGNKQETLNKALLCLNESMEINEKIPNNLLALASNVSAFGEIQMRKGNYIEARNNFRKVENMRETHLRDQNKNEDLMEKEKAQNLCHIAACEAQLQQYQQALNSYNKALQIYKNMYGSDHNKRSALALGNMSKIYYKQNQHSKARQCLSIALQIIQDVSGEEDPDYEHFQNLQSQLS